MRRSNTVSNFEKWVKLGFGQGSGKNYKSWFNLRDVPSKAVKTRLFSKRFQRHFLLLSHGEVAAFLWFEWLENVTDLREQFPLDPEHTLRIARETGIRHPGIHGEPIVMTTDFVITFKKEDGSQYLKCVQIKYDEADLLNSRTCEKLLIEELYWKEKGVPWQVCLSSEFNQTFIKNLEELFPYRNSAPNELILSNAAALLSLLRQKVGLETKLRTLGAWKISIEGNEMCFGAAMRQLLAFKRWKAPLETCPISDLSLREICL